MNDKNQQFISGNQVYNGILNVGDNNNNKISPVAPESERLFAALVAEIEAKLSGLEKQNALDDVKAIQEAVKNGNFDRAKKLYGVLSDLIRTSAAGLAIGSHFGWI
jgi:hypothetical protein